MDGNEAKILEKIKKRDARMLRHFYDAHHPQIFRFIFKQLGKKETAEELTQDVFYDFIEGIRDFRGNSSLKTYLFCIARNKVIDHIKKKKIKKILFSALPRYVVENVLTVFMDDQIERNELAEKIDKTIGKLPNDYQIILRLKYMDGHRVKEIAQKLALPFKTTESLLYRARHAFIKTFTR
ncbi:MAG: RNA polymerase sigma factor [Patescibacteria group bacterium]